MRQAYDYWQDQPGNHRTPRNDHSPPRGQQAGFGSSHGPRQHNGNHLDKVWEDNRNVTRTPKKPTTKSTKFLPHQAPKHVQSERLLSSFAAKGRSLDQTIQGETERELQQTTHRSVDTPFEPTKNSVYNETNHIHYRTPVATRVGGFEACMKQ